MSINIDLLRVAWEFQDRWDSWSRTIILAAAMPDVDGHDLLAAWDAVADLLAEITHLDARIAVDRLKEELRIAGGTNPQDAYNVVLGELEQDVRDTVRQWSRKTGRAA